MLAIALLMLAVFIVGVTVGAYINRRYVNVQIQRDLALAHIEEAEQQWMSDAANDEVV